MFETKKNKKEKKKNNKEKKKQQTEKKKKGMMLCGVELLIKRRHLKKMTFDEKIKIIKKEMGDENGKEKKK